MIAVEIQSRPKTCQAHLALADACESAGDLERALEHHRLYHQTKEEVSSHEANARLENLQTRFEVEQSEKEAEITRLRNEELQWTDVRRLLDDALELVPAARRERVAIVKEYGAVPRIHGYRGTTFTIVLPAAGPPG